MDLFDIAGDLPAEGTTVLEASAGTGKTWAVAALVARFVAEGAPLDRLLVITFSRAATQELRERVREGLIAAADVLARGPGEDPEPLSRALTRDAAGTPLAADQLALRRGRLVDAVANYDAATIATTHEFCHAVLRSLGVAGDSDSTDRLLEDISGLSQEVMDDCYLAAYSDLPGVPPIEPKAARRAALAALANPHAALRPSDQPADGEAGALVAFADGVRREVGARKRRANVLTFDDMLSRLAEAVAPVESPAAERMRSRWDVVLVDEFQDTDPVQWQVLRDAFSHQCRLVLIGDPKQAIYAFRGGDTPTYLQAVAQARTCTLGSNWRSDPAVVEALQVLTRGAQLGDPRITVHPVTAQRSTSSLTGAPGGVRLRQVRRDGFRLTKSGTVNIGAVRDRIADDLAGDVARTLESGATLDGRPLGPGDIAVLVHSVREEAPRLQRALAGRGIPSVLNASESVMLSPAAGHWARLLEALEKPQLPGRVRAAALTPFFATDADELAAGGDELTDRLAERVRGWLDLFRSRGIAAVQGAAQAGGLAARVLARPGGERLLTDLQHVGQLLHEAALEQRLGLTGLLGWLRTAVEEGNRTDSRRRRLDVDAEAVQFVTVHGAKGLEYPVVYLPQLFDRAVKDWPTIHPYHEGDLRCLDVADSAAAKTQSRAEEAQEELRLAYVAMTRARSEVVMWWAPTYNAGNGALTRLLFGRGPDEPEVPARAEFGSDDEQVDAVLRRWAAAGAFVLQDAVPSDVSTVPDQHAGALEVRTLDRDVDTAWRRTSYSGLVRVEQQQVVAVSSEPESPGTDDEDDAVDQQAGVLVPGGVTAGPPSPMNGLPAGATFGSLVHAVLEHADPQADDLGAELLDRVREALRWWSVPAAPEALASALLPMQHTPLGPLAGDLTLARIGMRDRLCELDFEFPMADGDRPGALGEPAKGLRLGAFADALRRHLPENDPVRAYADRIDSSLADQVLRGYLSGSIDVVLRVPGADGHRYVVVDYKTNTLGEPGRELSALDYTPELVAEAMVGSHYPLQALLYSVVLHRFLRWRLPDYDPERHLGGVLYLYVRGMAGAETPVVDGVPCGVFSWRPPVALIEELSAILDGRSSA